VLVGTTPLPPPERSDRPTALGFNLTFGLRSYLATPRLRGLLALHTSVAMAGAMIIVNTVVVVREGLGGSEVDVVLAFAASGAGSLVAALTTPALLRRVSLRSSMLAGAALLPVALVGGALAGDLTGLMGAWLLAGLGMSLVQTPAGRVIEASCNAADRPAFFSAHFSLSHAAWLIAYPIAGWIGAYAGLGVAFAVMAVGSQLAGVATLRLWPRSEAETLWHVHEALEHSHAHGVDDHHGHAHEHDDPEGIEPHAHRHQHDRLEHVHRFVIDTHHPTWPD
jgi:MFS family permease